MSPKRPPVTTFLVDVIKPFPYRGRVFQPGRRLTLLVSDYKKLRNAGYFVRCLTECFFRGRRFLGQTNACGSYLGYYPSVVVVKRESSPLQSPPPASSVRKKGGCGGCRKKGMKRVA